MRITDRQLELIRESCGRLRPAIDQMSATFYEDLFRAHPKIRAMFRGDMLEQGMKFLTALNEIVHLLDDRDGFDRRIEQLGRAHAAMGIPEGYFDAFQDALIDTFRRALLGGFTEDAEEAWRAAITVISRGMISVARRAA